ncbi:uncharacterized protein FRV6_10294 [Fusarium oxysporum]|uniref:FMN hydroxy acid dehydrogenase domain-containing protein n=1 Tax=Fusarium oxysporum TaxID=5507 RepID=A0A2H3TC77_FUSOX|nr:uncharacterized protein FRV6_10294 [Fusarium oxysporum]
MFLGHRFNYESAPLSTGVKALVNQAIYTPLVNVYFFGAHAFLSGENVATASKRIETGVALNIPRSILYWPLVTTLNFTYVQSQSRSIAASTAAVFWQSYMSYLNHRVETQNNNLETHRIQLPLHLSTLEELKVIYQFAGSDASSACNEARGPSLIRKSLESKFHVGSLDPEAVAKKPTLSGDNQSTEGKHPDQKPELDSIINLDDSQNAASKTLSRKAMAFISSGSNDNMTRDANRSFLNRIRLRPQVMRDVCNVTTSTTIFGCKLDLPVYIAPTGATKTGGSEGELTLARAAAAGGIIHCFATP